MAEAYALNKIAADDDCLGRGDRGTFADVTRAIVQQGRQQLGVGDWGYAYRKSSPSILVMQSTQDRTAQNACPYRKSNPAGG
jgi:hypothetical protein